MNRRLLVLCFALMPTLVCTLSVTPAQDNLNRKAKEDCNIGPPFQFTDDEEDEEEFWARYEDAEGIKARKEDAERCGYEVSRLANGVRGSVPLEKDGLTMEAREKKYKFRVKNLKALKQKKILHIGHMFYESEVNVNPRFRQIKRSAPFNDIKLWEDHTDAAWKGAQFQVLSADEAHRYLAGMAKYLLDIPDSSHEGDYRLELDTAELIEVEEIDGEVTQHCDMFVLSYRFVNIDRSKPKE